MTELAGLHALVTGGGRGIGAAIAQALTGAGAQVTVVGRSETPLGEVVADGEAAGWAICDVTDPAAVERAFGEAVAERGPLDILVNNAGGASSAPFHRTTDADFRAMLDLNLMGCVHACRAALPEMKARGRGRIVNIASTAALKGYPYVSAYVAAKHAVLGFTRALAAETAQSGVTVNAVCPGFTDTDLVARSVDEIVRKTGRDAAQARAELEAANPQGRLVAPDEVAAAVLFLCGPRAGAITGTALPVSGGEV